MKRTHMHSGLQFTDLCAAVESIAATIATREIFAVRRRCVVDGSMILHIFDAANRSC
jgi:hypothetical protein